MCLLIVNRKHRSHHQVHMISIAFIISIDFHYKTSFNLLLRSLEYFVV